MKNKYDLPMLLLTIIIGTSGILSMQGNYSYLKIPLFICLLIIALLKIISPYYRNIVLLIRKFIIMGIDNIKVISYSVFTIFFLSFILTTNSIKKDNKKIKKQILDLKTQIYKNENYNTDVSFLLIDNKLDSISESKVDISIDNFYYYYSNHNVGIKSESNEDYIKIKLFKKDGSNFQNPCTLFAKKDSINGSILFKKSIRQHTKGSELLINKPKYRLAMYFVLINNNTNDRYFCGKTIYN